jgi:hypothetical protein
MVGVLNEHNIVADIDQLAAQQPPRRELASPPPAGNIFRQSPAPTISAEDESEEALEAEDASDSSIATITNTSVSDLAQTPPRASIPSRTPLPASRPAPAATTDAIAHLFGFNSPTSTPAAPSTPPAVQPLPMATSSPHLIPAPTTTKPSSSPLAQPETANLLFSLQLTGPGINTQLDVVDVDDLALVRALLDKIERRLNR